MRNAVNDAETAPMTLAQIVPMLPALYSAASARANAAALRRVEKVMGRRLHHIAADVAAWQDLVRATSWSGQFQARTLAEAEANFQAWAKKIEVIIRRAVASGTPAAPRPTGADWTEFCESTTALEKARDAEGRPMLPNMSRLSAATLAARFPDCAPRDITFEKAVAALTIAPPDKKATLRRALRWLDKRIAERDRLPALARHLPDRPIGALPGLRAAPLDWSALHEDLQQEIKAVIRLAQKGVSPPRHRYDARLGVDPVAAARARRAKGRTKIRAPKIMEKSIRGALSFLLRHVVDDPADLHRYASLSELVTPENIELAVSRFAARAEAEASLKPVSESTSLGAWLSTLCTLALRAGLDVEEIEATVFELCIEHDVQRPGQAEMSRDRENFLRLLDRDPDVAKAIITAPDRLAAEVRRAFALWDDLGDRQRSEALHLCIAASIFAMQLSRPLRPKNLNELSEIDGGAQIQRDGAGRLPWLCVPRSEVKNRALLDNPISARQWPVIELWLDEGRDKWCAHHDIPREAPQVYPGTTGRAFSRALFNRAWNRGCARVGIRGLTPHMMRHVCVTLLLARRPGAYGVAADLIGDDPKTLRRFYARGEGAAATQMFAEILEEISPAIRLL